jgi:hypothetical protein
MNIFQFFDFSLVCGHDTIIGKIYGTDYYSAQSKNKYTDELFTSIDEAAKILVYRDDVPNSIENHFFLWRGIVGIRL